MDEERDDRNGRKKEKGHFVFKRLKRAVYRIYVQKVLNQKTVKIDIFAYFLPLY